MDSGPGRVVPPSTEPTVDVPRQTVQALERAPVVFGLVELTGDGWQVVAANQRMRALGGSPGQSGPAVDMLMAEGHHWAVDVDDPRHHLLVGRDASDHATRRVSPQALARMRHDLANPLNEVLGFTQLLEFEPLSGTASATVQHILSAATRMIHLIDEMLGPTTVEDAADSAVAPPASLAQPPGEIH